MTRDNYVIIYHYVSLSVSYVCIKAFLGPMILAVVFQMLCPSCTQMCTLWHTTLAPLGNLVHGLRESQISHKKAGGSGSSTSSMEYVYIYIYVCVCIHAYVDTYVYLIYLWLWYVKKKSIFKYTYIHVSSHMLLYKHIFIKLLSIHPHMFIGNHLVSDGGFNTTKPGFSMKAVQLYGLQPCTLISSALGLKLDLFTWYTKGQDSGRVSQETSK